jgi:glycosyltransferase involved in cell wall biosynthesis
LEVIIFYASNQEFISHNPDERISVVMITRNRGSQIRTALEQLLALPERPHIIVIDNGSSDETVEIARAMGTAVDVIALDQNLACAGRNIGILKAGTPYVAFSDDDSWWAPGALGRAADLFDSNSTLGLIAARILIGPEEKLDPLCQVMVATHLDLQGDNGQVGVPVVGFAACGSVVRRAAFLQTGGFERRLGVGGEEHILALDLLRHGWQLAYVDEIVAHHHPSPIRDRDRRKRLEARNTLWSAWLRRPAGSALVETWRLVKRAFRDHACRAGLAEAIAGMPWVLSAREPVSAAIDRQVKIAERVFHQSSGSS